MAQLEELVVSLVAETKGLRDDLDKAVNTTKKSTDKMEKDFDELSKNSSKSLTFLQTSVASAIGFIGSNIVLGAVNKLGDAFGFLTNQLLEGAKAANQDEASTLKMANSLALTGQYTRQAVIDLKDFAEQIQRTTGLEASLVQENIALLSSMTKLSSDGLQKASQAAIDLASAYKMDLFTATQLIGKGIEGNISAFSRYGIKVEEGSNKAETFTNILKALEGIQGTAAGSTKTYEGSVLKASNAFGKLGEATARTVTQNQSVLAVITLSASKFLEAAGNIDKTNYSLQQLVSKGLSGTLDILAMTALGFDAMARVASASIDTISASIQGLNTIVYGLLSVVSDQFDEAFQASAKAADEAMKGINESLTGETGLSAIAQHLLDFKQASDQAFSSLKEGAIAGIEPTVALGVAVESLTAKQKANAEEGKQIAEDLINDSIENNELKLELLEEQIGLEKEKIDEARAQELISKEEHEAALTELEKKSTEDRNKIAAKSNLEKMKLEATKNTALINMAQSAANLITAVAGSQSKEAFIISRVAALAQSQVATELASANALASVPYPANLGVAAQVRAAGMLNTAAIAATAIQGLQNGIDSVPGIGSRDSFPAMLAPKERVLPGKTNQDLTNFLDNQKENGGSNGGSSQSVEVSIKPDFMDFIEARIVQRLKTGESQLKGQSWA